MSFKINYAADYIFLSCIIHHTCQDETCNLATTCENVRVYKVGDCTWLLTALYNPDPVELTHTVKSNNNTINAKNNQLYKRITENQSWHHAFVKTVNVYCFSSSTHHRPFAQHSKHEWITKVTLINFMQALVRISTTSPNDQEQLQLTSD